MNDIPVKEIGELLNEVSDKLPKLVSGLMSTMYSAESGKAMGQAVGSFYKELDDAGIPNDEALRMAKDYMLSLKDIAGSFTNNSQKN